MTLALAYRRIERLPTLLVLLGMALGALLIYRTVSLPLIAVGLLMFGGLALLRPALGLLFVPITTPWYLSPVYVPDVRSTGTVFSLHEVLLLVVLAAALGHWLIDVTVVRSERSQQRPTFSLQGMREYLPHALFLLAGVLGVIIAIERSPALRDFRWMVVEPLIFYGMFRWLYRRETHYIRMMTVALIGSGVFVALLGLLQAAGVNLVPVLLSPTKSFADSVVEVGNAARVASVYGHPNNLGMFLGRVWPLAAVLAVASQGPGIRGQGSANLWQRWLFGGCTVVLLAGLFVSFSRGAWLGAGAALTVLVVGWGLGAGGWRLGSRGKWFWLGSVVVLAVLALIGGLVFSLRGGVAGGSADARLLFWRESLQLIVRHPLGLGLDQFYYYHNPDFGRSLIDPSLIGTSEQYAKHPHNLVFELWLLLTPLGLAAFVWLLVRFVRRAAAVFRATPHGEIGLLALGTLAAITAALTHGLVDTFYFWPDIAITFWLLIGMVDLLYTAPRS